MQTAERTDLDRLAVDTVRVLAMDAIQKAGSGHPGTAMALAPAAYVLWTRFLKFDPADSEWFDRDRMTGFSWTVRRSSSGSMSVSSPSISVQPWNWTCWRSPKPRKRPAIPVPTPIHAGTSPH
jgi:hypothetical protein